MSKQGGGCKKKIKPGGMVKRKRTKAPKAQGLRNSRLYPGVCWALSVRIMRDGATQRGKGVQDG